MSVYNAGEALAACMDSLLAQEGCDFEVVAIDDGSTDGSGERLDDYAGRDPRVRVFHQQNQGLTRALIRGCAEARGEFIARQDADDISLPGRLKSQCEFLQAHPDIVAVAGGARTLAPGGEWMFDVMPPDRIEADLAKDWVSLPLLCAACFRREAYERAGGFRAIFTVAQDIDLWLRLLECGPCVGARTLAYQTVVTPGGITSRRRPEQVRLVALAMACARRRREGAGDQDLLAAHRPAPPAPSRPARHRAAFFYFVGSCLRRHDPEAARRYFQLATRENPFHLKAQIRRMMT
jgi:glycosyltransferase involved in cell wall biosynthesis